MEQLKIGTLTLPHRAVLGPMAGFTDAPCRRLMAQHGAGFTVSEMVSGRALVYQDRKTAALLRAEPNDAPYGVQLFGDDPEINGPGCGPDRRGTVRLFGYQYGLSCTQIVSAGAGSKLMLDPELCGRIVEQVAAHTTRPVTVKMRKGWDADHITAVECAKACAQGRCSGHSCTRPHSGRDVYPGHRSFHYCGGKAGGGCAGAGQRRHSYPGRCAGNGAADRLRRGHDLPVQPWETPGCLSR